MKRLSRRHVLQGSAALGLTVFAAPIKAAPPPAEPITPAVIDAARREGKLAFYPAMALAFAERMGKIFEEKFGITVRVERSGAERIFTRIGQEYPSSVYAVDGVNTADAAHCIEWKRQGGRAPCLPADGGG